jgi:hypothetical protein
MLLYFSSENYVMLHRTFVLLAEAAKYNCTASTFLTEFLFKPIISFTLPIRVCPALLSAPNCPTDPWVLHFLIYKLAIARVPKSICLHTPIMASNPLILVTSAALCLTFFSSARVSFREIPRARKSGISSRNRFIVYVCWAPIVLRCGLYDCLGSRRWGWIFG